MDDAKYEKAVEELLAKTVAELRAVDADAIKLGAAIDAYLQAGDDLGMSPYELRDYFDISSPGLAEEAGYSGDNLDKASMIFTQVSNARYQDT